MHSTSLSATEVRALLSHPDPSIRSWADWLREARGEGWRGFNPNTVAAAEFERCIARRLAQIETDALDAWQNDYADMARHNELRNNPEFD